MDELTNAIIKSATITSADHGLLSAWLFVEFDCGGQGFGGYCLYVPKTSPHHKMASPAGHFIWRCMEIAGVTSWDELPGKTIRIKHSHSSISEIGHIVKNDWFSPKKDFEDYTKEEG